MWRKMFFISFLHVDKIVTLSRIDRKFGPVSLINAYDLEAKYYNKI
jgi:hypothetical protein